MKIIDKTEKPSYVCFDCGNKFLSEEQNNQDRVITVHHSSCDLCGVSKGVTHVRNFNYLTKKQ